MGRRARAGGGGGAYAHGADRPGGGVTQHRSTAAPAAMQRLEFWDAKRAASVGFWYRCCRLRLLVSAIILKMTDHLAPVTEPWYATQLRRRRPEPRRCPSYRVPTTRTNRRVRRVRVRSIQTEPATQPTFIL